MAALCGLMALSFALAMTRVYQVDEAQTVYMATVLAKGWTGSLFTSGQLHLYPLSLLARIGSSSATTFLVFRACFWALFWVNAALAVRASGLRVRSSQGVKGLVLMGTLAPWWGYALECRHDNILITGLLVLWILARRTRMDRDRVFLGLGFVSLLLHACLFKAIALWAPLAVLWVYLEPGGWGTRARRAGAWFLGAAGGYLACQAFKALVGNPSLAGNGQGALQVAASAERFAPWNTLRMLLGTSPLLVAAMGGLLLLGAMQLRRRGLRGAWEAEAGFPEILLFVVCAFAFFVNPTPFPYNLAVLTTGAMVALLALGRPWFEPGAFNAVRGLPFLISSGLLLHLTPWTLRVAELFSLTNERQEEIMAMTEAFTGPEDPVFDGIGMVPTRRAPTYEWVINWANQGRFREHPLFAGLGDQVPPVVLPSYRLGYLPPSDRAFLSANYLLLHKDFWVLGASPRASAEPGTWTCLRSGRYALIPIRPNPGPVTLDGKPLPRGITWIAKGPHQLAMDPAAPSALSWVGPTAQTPPTPGNDGAPSLCPVPGGF
ncbi:hypothetical protein [Mesoterricola silvestris]|uniref:hypothetical protein n=1 Tax=Mesoterricola silvestris TaxID=2927979 RepID=UPI00292F7EDD|nr:hypothetical protein [Mesoterricola silvestris]